METPIHKLISEHLRVNARGKKNAVSKAFIEQLVEQYGHLTSKGR